MQPENKLILALLSTYFSLFQLIHSYRILLLLASCWISGSCGSSATATCRTGRWLTLLLMPRGGAILAIKRIQGNMLRVQIQRDRDCSGRVVNHQIVPGDACTSIGGASSRLRRRRCPAGGGNRDATAADRYPRPDRDRRGERLIQVQRLQRVAAQEAGYYFVCSFSSPAAGGRRPGASFVPTEGRNAHDPRPWCKMHAVLLVCGAQGTQTETMGRTPTVTPAPPVPSTKAKAASIHVRVCLA